MGTLYTIGTPIGNLGDITLRALEVLKSVDLVLSEDTRETHKIFAKYGISVPQISYRDQNHEQVVAHVLGLLEQDKNLALVSDSGTPLVSDPGFKLVEAVRNTGGKILPIPGPSSITAALSAAGLPTDKFVFLGFLPKKSSQMEKMLTEYGNLDATLVILESPFRVRKLLELVLATLGNRKVALCREMTKMYEEILVDNVENLLSSKFKEKGEFVVLVAKNDY